jgi:hypothetical protein
METLMSKGPGKIQRAVEALFIAQPDTAFTVEDLATASFPGINHIEKKHRVSVLRAAAKASVRTGWSHMTAEALGGMAIFFNQRSTRSYVLAKARARFPDQDAATLSEWLESGRKSNGAIEKLRANGKPGEAYDLHVRLFIAQLGGEEEAIESLRRQIDAKAIEKYSQWERFSAD